MKAEVRLRTTPARVLFRMEKHHKHEPLVASIAVEGRGRRSMQHQNPDGCVTPISSSQKTTVCVINKHGRGPIYFQMGDPTHYHGI